MSKRLLITRSIIKNGHRGYAINVASLIPFLLQEGDKVSLSPGEEGLIMKVVDPGMPLGATAEGGIVREIRRTKRGGVLVHIPPKFIRNLGLGKGEKLWVYYDNGVFHLMPFKK